MDWTAPRLVAGLAVIIVLFAAHLHLWALHRRAHLALWTAAWGLALARYGLLALLPDSLDVDTSPAFVAYIVTFATVCLLLTAGNYLLVGRRPPWRLVAVVAAAYLWVLATKPLGLAFEWRTLPPYLSLGLVLFLGGRVLVAARDLDRLTRWSAGLAMFAAAATLTLFAPWAMDNPWFAQWGWISSGLLLSWMGISLLMLHFQQQNNLLRRAEADLAQTAGLYRSLADTMAEGMLVFDHDEAITYVNPRLCQIFGRAPQAMLGGHVEALFGPANMDERSWQAFTALREGRGRDAKPLEIERFSRDDGVALGLRILAGALRDEAGRFRGMVLLVSDITARLRLDGELAQNRALLQSILEAMDDAVYAVAVNDPGNVHFNKAAERLLGFEPGRPAHNAQRPLLAIHPDDRHLAQLKQRRLAENGDGQWEYRVVRPDGQARWVRDRARLARNAQGRPLRAVSVLVDITERLEAQRQIEERRRFFQALYEQSMNPIVIIDAQRRVIEANPAAQAYFGYGPDEIVGLSTTVAHLDQAMFEAFAREAHAQVAASGAWRGEWPLRARDGRLLHVEMAVSALEQDADGRPRTLMALMHDTTQRKLYEQKINAALEEKEVLLREIHHRVKNNMQVIQSLIWMQASQVGDDGMRRLFSEVERRISAMALIHETLYQSDNLAHLDLQQYIQRLCQGLTGLFEGPAAHIAWDIDCQAIRLDLDKAVSVGLVLNELVTNALKHAFDQRGGTVAISAGQDGDGRIAIRVADDGRGLPPGQDGAAGRSLGLFLVRGLVQRQLKGELEITTGPGVEFVIRFAAGQAQEQP